VDGLMFWGDVDTVTESPHAHVAAGADHVAVQVIGTPPGPGGPWAVSVMGGVCRASART
jgi:hypothetical protein